MKYRVTVLYELCFISYIPFIVFILYNSFCITGKVNCCSLNDFLRTIIHLYICSWRNCNDNLKDRTDFYLRGTIVDWIALLKMMWQLWILSDNNYLSLHIQHIYYFAFYFLMISFWWFQFFDIICFFTFVYF